MNCKTCKKEFEIKNKANKNLYCSRSCFLSVWTRARGKEAWNKGKKTGFNLKQSLKLKGRPTWNKGLKMTKGMVGKNHWNWNGGVAGERQLAMRLSKYKDWRMKVFQRDDYTCQECKAKCGNGKSVILNADHIKPWALFPGLRYEISNGRTLCRECHYKIGWSLFREKNPSKNYALTQ